MSGAVGSLGVEALELKNWLIRFSYASKELWVEVSGLVDCLTN